MQKKTLIFFLCILINISTAQAELSSNPWTNPNEKEEIQKIYKKQQKNYNGENYIPEATTVIEQLDTTHYETEVETENNSSDILNRIKNLFKDTNSASKQNITEKETQEQPEPTQDDFSQTPSFLDKLSKTAELINTLTNNEESNTYSSNRDISGPLHNIEQKAKTNLKSILRQLQHNVR